MLICVPWFLFQGPPDVLPYAELLHCLAPHPLSAISNVFALPFVLPQGVPMEDVMRVLRKRFGTSGIEEKAARPPKQ